LPALLSTRVVSRASRALRAPPCDLSERAKSGQRADKEAGRFGSLFDHFLFTFPIVLKGKFASPLPFWN
jgi:hypothetical protein